MGNFNRTLQQAKSSAVELATFFAEFTGAGAGAPTVSAATRLLLKDNCAAGTVNGLTTGIVRNGAGDYTFTLPWAPGAILNIHPSAIGASSLDAFIQTWSITSGRLVFQVKTFTAAGVATDLANGTDFLRVTFHVNMSNT